MFFSAFIHESAAPAARTAALLRGLQQRKVPAAFHYETPRQARHWLALHAAYSPAQREAAGAAMYQQAGVATAAQLAAGEVLVIGLGCGGGQKDRWLVQACVERGLKVHYAPVDISLSLVLTAAQAAAPLVQQSGGRLLPVVADLTASEDWRAWVQSQVPAGAAIIITYFGLLPTLSPAESHDCLGRWWSAGSRLLFSANLIPGGKEAAGLQAILPQYDNTLTRRWLGLFLEDSGIAAHAGEMQFSMEQYAGQPPVWSIAADWVFREAVDWSLGGAALSCAAGERLRLFASYRYTLAQVAAMVGTWERRLAGTWTDAAGEEAVFLSVDERAEAGNVIRF